MIFKTQLFLLQIVINNLNFNIHIGIYHKILIAFNS